MPVSVREARRRKGRSYRRADDQRSERPLRPSRSPSRCFARTRSSTPVPSLPVASWVSLARLRASHVAATTREQPRGLLVHRRRHLVGRGAHVLDRLDDQARAAALLIGRAVHLFGHVLHRVRLLEHDVVALLLLARGPSDPFGLRGHLLDHADHVASPPWSARHRLHDALDQLLVAARDPRISISERPACSENSTPFATLWLPSSIAPTALALSSWTERIRFVDLGSARRHARRELADLAGHHREAAPVLARLRGDDRGVEREQAAPFATPSITSTIAPISPALSPSPRITLSAVAVASRIACMPSIVCCTIREPWSATPTTWSESSEQRSAFGFTSVIEVAISSIDEEASPGTPASTWVEAARRRASESARWIDARPCRRARSSRARCRPAARPPRRAR